MPGSKRRRHTAPTPPLRNGAAHGSAMGGKRSEKKKKLGDETRAKAYAQAGLDYDPRTAAGMRERDIQDLGSTKRARPPAYAKLLRGEATPERCLAAVRFESLWNWAMEGEMPPPRFLPKVDNSSRPGGALPSGSLPKEELGRLTSTIGIEGVALLYARLILHRTYTSLSPGSDPKHIVGAFVAALDGAVRFFGISVEESPTVRLLNAAFRASDQAPQPSTRPSRRPSSAAAGSGARSARAAPSR